MDEQTLASMLSRGKAAGIHTRGISEHGFIRSVYFRDPNGYVIELTAKTAEHDATMAREGQRAHAKLAQWQATKPRE